MQGKKVILICTQLEAGGAQKASVRLAGELSKRNYLCENWFLYKKRDAFLTSHNIFSILPRPVKSATDYLVIAYRLYKKLKKNKPDAVVTFTHYANVLGLIVAWLSGVKIRVASHRNPSWGDMSKTLIAIDKFCANTGIYTVITAVSESTKKTFDYYPDKIYDQVNVIKNGINYEASAFTKDESREFLGLPANVKLIGTTGRLSNQKNQKILIDAVANSSIHLAIVGEGELKEELAQRVIDTGTTQQVHFLGEIPGEKIPHFLKALDIYVMPSLFEGLSNALVEALCAGVPVMASDIPSQRDVIISDDGALNGVLLPVDDSAAWRKAIDQVLEDENLGDYYAGRSLIRSKDFSIEEMTNGFINALKTAI